MDIRAVRTSEVRVTALQLA